MNDRELIELAAKSAGICGYVGSDMGRLYFCTPADPSLPRSDPVICFWLDDDGDAFRLACDLGLMVYPVARTMAGAACSAVADVTGNRLSEITHASLGVRVATRRAIVHAAAEIGKQMEAK